MAATSLKKVGTVPCLAPCSIPSSFNSLETCGNWGDRLLERHVVPFTSDERFQQLNGPESFLLHFLFNSITSIPSETQVFKPSTDTKLDVFSLEDVESTSCKNYFDYFDLFLFIRTVFHFASVLCKRNWTQIRWRCFWIVLVSSLHDGALNCVCAWRGERVHK